MKVGNLVRWISLEFVDEHRQSAQAKCGVVVEWDEATTNASGRQIPAAGWVQWLGDYDWSIVYEDQVEVLSENR